MQNSGGSALRMGQFLKDRRLAKNPERHERQKVTITRGMCGIAGGEERETMTIRSEVAAAKAEI